MFALILESLSSTELLFILVIALIFFGPRKLPQLARSMGKGLAEFRKASDDFKRTWEREVAMETAKLDQEANTILSFEETTTYTEQKITPEPLVEQADPELVVARETTVKTPQETTEALNTSGEPVPTGEPVTPQPQPLRKQDWL